MLAYAVLPFPVWLMKRFRLPKSKATVVTAAVLAGASLMVAFCLEFGIARLMTRMPLYEQNLAGLHEQVAAFLSAHGIDSASLSLKQILTPERFGAVTFAIIPQAGAIVARVLLISNFRPWLTRLSGLACSASADGKGFTGFKTVCRDAGDERCEEEDAAYDDAGPGDQCAPLDVHMNRPGSKGS